MAITIPDATLGATFTNDITGTTYTYDGQKWVAEGGGGSHEHDEQYVNRDGDEMSAGLKVKYKADEGSMGLGVVRTSYSDTDYESRVQASIIYAQNDGNTKFRVTNKGQVQAGHDSSQAFIAEQDNDLTTKKYVDDTIFDEISAIRQTDILASADLEWKVLTNVDSGDPPEGIAFVNGDSFANLNTIRFNLKPFNRTSLPFSGAVAGNQVTMYSRSGASTASSSMLLSCYLYVPTSSNPVWKWIGTGEVEKVVLTENHLRVELRTSSHRWGSAGLTPSLGYRFRLSSLF